MTSRIAIHGVKPYDGEYEFDPEEQPLTTLEWRWIKKISGYLPLTISDGIDGGDPDVFVAFATVALARAGTIERSDVFRVADRLIEAPFDGASITFVDDNPDDDGGDDGPPAEASAT